MFPFEEILSDATAPDTEGMAWMASPPADILGFPGPCFPPLLPRADLAGSFLSRLAHTVTQPLRSAVNVAERAVETPFQVAERVAMTPFALMSRAANKLPSFPSRSPGGGAPAPMPMPMPDPSAMQDPGTPDGGDDMSSGYQMGQRHPGGHVVGFHLADYLPSFMKSKGAGELLVSSVPGGATAKEAHAIANKALKDGTLNPQHVKGASALLKKARAGHTPSMRKIAALKRAAGSGDPHAEVAMDRLKLVNTLQTGRQTEATGGTSSLRHLRNIGLATLR